jgi:hypothetical protein
MPAKKLSEEFHRLSELYAGKTVTFAEVAESLDAKTQALVCLVLSLPFLFFLPLPGLSILFGVFIFLNGFRIAAKTRLWFPAFVKHRKISARTLEKSLKIAERWSIKLERIVRPRGRFSSDRPFWVRVNGIVLCFCGFFLALPLPPGTNFFPALNAVFLSLGILEEDALMILIAYCLFILNLVLYLALPILGLTVLANNH